MLRSRIGLCIRRAQGRKGHSSHGIRRTSGLKRRSWCPQGARPEFRSESGATGQDLVGSWCQRRRIFAMKPSLSHSRTQPRPDRARRHTIVRPSVLVPTGIRPEGVLATASIGRCAPTLFNVGQSSHESTDGGQFWSTLVNFGRKIGHELAHIVPSRFDSGPNWSNCGPNRPEFGQHFDSWSSVCATSEVAGLAGGSYPGRAASNSATAGVAQKLLWESKCCPNSGRFGPLFDQFGPESIN